MSTEESKPTFQEQFCIYQQQKLQEQEIKESSDESSSKFNFQAIIEFDKKFNEFVNMMESTIAQFLEFWRELQEEQIQLKKLTNYANNVINSLELLDNLFNYLMQLNYKHQKTTEIYIYFLAKVANNQLKAKELQETLNIKDKEDATPKKGSTQSNAIAILTISGNKINLGSILNSNNEIKDLLGFQKNDIIGQNINILSPKIIGDNHTALVESYLQSQKTYKLLTDQVVYAQDKEGYLVPLNMTLKVVPNLLEGLQILAFLKHFVNKDEKSFQTKSKNKDFYYLMYDDDYGAIYGWNINFSNYFQIPSFTQVSQLGQNSAMLGEVDQICSIENVCQEMFEIDNIEKMKKSKQGLHCQLIVPQQWQKWKQMKQQNLEQQSQDSLVMIDEEKNEKNVRDTFKFKTETMDESMDRRFGETTSWTKFSNTRRTQQQRYCMYAKAKIAHQFEYEFAKINIVKFKEIDEHQYFQQKDQTQEITSANDTNIKSFKTSCKTWQTLKTFQEKEKSAIMKDDYQQLEEVKEEEVKTELQLEEVEEVEENQEKEMDVYYKKISQNIGASNIKFLQ